MSNLDSCPAYALLLELRFCSGHRFVQAVSTVVAVGDGWHVDSMYAGAFIRQGSGFCCCRLCGHLHVEQIHFERVFPSIDTVPPALRLFSAIT